MKRAIALSVVMLALAGCGHSGQDRAVSGGLIGAGAGALIGGDVTGALVGGAIGAGAGYATSDDANGRHRHHNDQ
jgi:hypothetical protein